MKTQVGIDLGRSGTKVVAAFKAAKGKEPARERLFFPAGVTRAFRLEHPDAAVRAAKDTVVVEGDAYFIGETALLQADDTVQSGLRADWATTPQHAALLKGAMMKLAAANVPGLASAHVTVGLPGALYGVQRGEYEQIVRRHLPGCDVTVLPQPLGPFFATVFDASGEVARPEMMSEAWATVEIGQYTTDTCLVIDGATVENAFDSCDGMFVVAKQLIRELRRTKDVLDVKMPEATEAMVRRTIRVAGGQDVSIDEELETVSRQLAEHILAFVPSAIGQNWRKLKGVLVAGGGAPLLFPKLAEAWPMAVLCPDPRYAVAEGFVRVGLAEAAQTAEG